MNIIHTLGWKEQERMLQMQPSWVLNRGKLSLSLTCSFVSAVQHALVLHSCWAHFWFQSIVFWDPKAFLQRCFLGSHPTACTGKHCKTFCLSLLNSVRCLPTLFSSLFRSFWMAVLPSRTPTTIPSLYHLWALQGVLCLLFLLLMSMLNGLNPLRNVTRK